MNDIDLIAKANSWAKVWNYWKNELNFIAFCEGKNDSSANLINSWFDEQLKYIKILEITIEEYQEDIDDLNKRLGL